MAIKIALEKWKREEPSIEHISRDSDRLDSNPKWRKVKGKLFTTLSKLETEDHIRIVVCGNSTDEVANKVKSWIKKLERPKPSRMQTS